MENEYEVIADMTEALEKMAAKMKHMAKLGQMIEKFPPEERGMVMIMLESFLAGMLKSHELREKENPSQ